VALLTHLETQTLDSSRLALGPKQEQSAMQNVGNKSCSGRFNIKNIVGGDKKSSTSLLHTLTPHIKSPSQTYIAL